MIKQTILIVFILLSFTSYSYSQEFAGYYEKGIQQKKAGEWSQALNSWMAGWNELDEKGDFDPRLGIAFIETVTEQKLEHFYGTASDMYMWGLSENNFGDHADVFFEEAKRLMPLVDDEDAKTWESDIRNKGAGLIKKMRQFWILKDPTPKSLKNERLIEHWERIAYARKNYKKRNNTVYETDDRGLIYVKYGKPHTRSSGELHNDTELQLWVPDFVDRLNLESRYSLSPSYELWVYNNVDENERVPFLFADAVGSPFRLVNGVEELIEKRAFRTRNVRQNQDGSVAMPGVYFQLMYYDRLRVFANSYDDRYNELYSLMVNPSTRSSDMYSIRSRFVGADWDSPLQRYAVKEKSALDQVIKPINILPTQARLLDEENNPKLSIIAISYPSGIEDVSELTNSLIINDEEWNKIDIIDHKPENTIDNTSVFLVDHIDSTRNYMLTSEAFQQKEVEGLTAENSVKVDKIQFIGKQHLEKLDPLSSNPNELEVSDLLVGIPVPDNAAMDGYPFPILPTRRIVKGDPLLVYVEVYHLFFSGDNKTRYTIDFQVSRNGDKGIFNKIIGRGKRKEVISQTYTNESQTSTIKERISFDISELRKGDYEFLLEITDLVSGQKKRRLGNFKLIE